MADIRDYACAALMLQALSHFVDGFFSDKDDEMQVQACSALWDSPDAEDYWFEDSMTATKRRELKKRAVVYEKASAVFDRHM